MFQIKRFSPIGLEISSTSIQAVQLKKNGNGWELKEMARKELASGGNGQEKNGMEEMSQALKTLLKESSFSGSSVVSVMPWDRIDILPMRLTLAKDEDLEQALLREAAAYLSYDLEEAVIDYLPLEERSGEQGNGKNRKVLLIGARREDVDAHFALLKGAKLTPKAIDIRAAALSRLFTCSEGGEEKNRLVINMGDEISSLTVLSGDAILLDRTIPWGREKLVQRLQNQLELDSGKSKDLLLKKGLSVSQDNGQAESMDPMSETVTEIVAPEVEKLCDEIDRVSIFFSSEMRGALLDELVLMGRCPMIHHLDHYLQKRIGVPADYFDPLHALGLSGSGADDTGQKQDRPLYGVALGLALRSHPENQP